MRIFGRNRQQESSSEEVAEPVDYRASVIDKVSAMDSELLRYTFENVTTEEARSMREVIATDAQDVELISVVADITGEHVEVACLVARGDEARILAYLDEVPEKKRLDSSKEAMSVVAGRSDFGIDDIARFAENVPGDTVMHKESVVTKVVKRKDIPLSDVIAFTESAGRKKDRWEKFAYAAQHRSDLDPELIIPLLDRIPAYEENRGFPLKGVLQGVVKFLEGDPKAQAQFCTDVPQERFLETLKFAAETYLTLPSYRYSNEPPGACDSEGLRHFIESLPVTQHAEARHAVRSALETKIEKGHGTDFHKQQLLDTVNLALTPDESLSGLLSRV